MDRLPFRTLVQTQFLREAKFLPLRFYEGRIQMRAGNVDGLFCMSSLVMAYCPL